MARPDGKRTGAARARDVGVDAVRRLKEILREGSPPSRPLPSFPPPPNLDEGRAPRPGLRLARRSRDDEDDE